MIELRLNSQNLRELLEGPPKIGDSMNGVCRTLEFTVRKESGLNNSLGQVVELWFNNSRWFIGTIRRRGYSSTGSIQYMAYDPLYVFNKNPDDWYFKYVTATQAIRQIAGKLGLKISSLTNTGVTLPPLLYQKAEPDKIVVDLLARTHAANKRKYWYRYKPDVAGEGLIVYENVLPSKLWAFQVGVNLINAEYTESIEETVTIVKLVNRETGKIVSRTNSAALSKYGPATHFEEVEKDKAATMEKQAQDLLTKLSVIKTTLKGEGINPNGVMPQLFSGNAIYVEEPNTGIMGGYYITNITQTFENDSLINIAFDIQAAPDIPTIQYDDATDTKK